MQRQFKAFSLSHRNAPLNVRELFALDKDDIHNLLHYFKEFTEVRELMIVSTCNRVEVYYSADQDFTWEIIKRLGVERNIADVIAFQDYFKFFNHPQQALKHLFYMAMGLESRVMGDLQIISQVKTAYQMSADAGTAGPFLHRAMHTIFSTHKRVTKETEFKHGGASVPYTTVKLIQELVLFFKNPRILLLGSGKMSSEICQSLSKNGFKDVWWSNRSYKKVQTLADQYGFQALTLKQGLREIGEFDIIVSALAVKQPLIGCSLIKKRTDKNQYFIDLSVPRSIAPEVEKISGIQVYNIDSIQEQVSNLLKERRQWIPQVMSIIDESIYGLNKWSQEMALAPAIKKMKQALEQIRQQELKRYLKDVTSENREIVELVTKSMIHKIVKLPMLKLKTQCLRDQAEHLNEVLVQIFDLENQSKKQL